MPFVKRTNTKHNQVSTDNRKIFIGRTHELQFFVEHILTPEDPTYNIISVAGDGGVGKSTLLLRFINEACSPHFKEFCLTAFVDDQQPTPYMIMEKIAEQLSAADASLVEFEKALTRYKEAMHKLQIERETAQDTAIRETVDLVGATAEELPVVGGLLHKGANVITEFYLKEHHTRQLLKNTILLEDPMSDLTKVFVEGLNRLTEREFTLSSNRTKRFQRIILFFDTFEHLTDEVAPWLLKHFLPSNISTNVIIVVAGRNSIEQSTSDPKQWLPYHDNGVIYFINLDSFTEEETRMYLVARDITNPTAVKTIWHLSQGLPLYLSLLTFNLPGDIDPTADVVANFLRWIPEQEHVKRQLALDAALFSKPFNQDDLTAFDYLPANERIDLFDWLIRLPFVKSNPQDGHYRYHDLAQEMFRRYLFQRSKKEYYITSRMLLAHYRSQIEEMQRERGKGTNRTTEWMEVVFALSYQLLALPDQTSHIDAVEQILNAYKSTNAQLKGEVVKFLRDLSQGQLNKQMSPESLLITKQLFQYIAAIEGDQSQKLIEAASVLLKRLAHYSAFSKELLAWIYRSRGLTYVKLKEYQRAVQDYDRAIELDPTFVAAYSSRALAYSNLEEYRQAVQDYDRAIKLDPTFIYAYRNRGWAYKQLKEYQRAIEDFDRAIEINPTNAHTYRIRGLTYSNLKEYQQAIQDYDRAIELDPTFVAAYNSRGLAYADLKEQQQAIQNYDRAIELDPTFVAAYNNRGLAYADLKEQQQAIQDYDRAIELDPNDVIAICNRGLTYVKLKEYQRAVQDYDRAIELDPTYVTAYYNRGLTYSNLKEYQQAIQDYDRAIELDPTFVAAYSSRALAYSNLEEYRQAVQDYDRAIKLDPTLAYAYHSRGLAYSNLEEYQRAIEDFDRAIEINPTYAAYHNRGRAYTDLKEYQLAIQDCSRAVELNPNNASVFYLLGFNYTWLQDLRNAIVNFTRCKELDPTDILACWAIEWLGMCLDKEDPGRIKRLETIAAINPQDDIAYTCFGVAAWLGGNYEMALLELEKAISIDPKVGGAYFWKTMSYTSLRRDEEALVFLKKAMTVHWPVPPILLTLSAWLEDERPDFYKHYVLPLIKENQLATKTKA
jgi:tetratricopeptide (TPR) repeat protein